MTHVQTVTGPVDPDTLDFTLPHEHIHLELWSADGESHMSQLDDDDVLAAELLAFRSVGGSCLVDQTPRGAGRRPERLRQLSERTGVAIVCSTGWYTEPFYPPGENLARRSVREIAAVLESEIRDGIGDSGVRPGLIGEIGTSRGWVSPLEERVHRAAARTQRATGLPLGTHTLYHGAGLHQIEIFEEEGVDPARVCIGHCDTYPSIDYGVRVAEWGAYVSLDNIGLQLGDHEQVLVRLVQEMVERGFAERLLLSQDMGQMTELGSRGGRGLTYVAERFLPALRQAGVDERTIELITVENPRRWLTIDVS